MNGFAQAGQGVLQGLEAYSKLTNIQDRRKAREQEAEMFKIQKKQAEQAVEVNNIRNQAAFLDLQAAQEQATKEKIQKGVMALSENAGDLSMLNTSLSDPVVQSRTGVASIDYMTGDDTMAAKEKIYKEYGIDPSGALKDDNANVQAANEQLKAKKYKVNAKDPKTGEFTTMYLNEEEFGNRLRNLGVVPPEDIRKQQKKKQELEQLQTQQKLMEVGKKNVYEVGGRIYEWSPSKKRYEKAGLAESYKMRDGRTATQKEIAQFIEVAMVPADQRTKQQQIVYNALKGKFDIDMDAFTKKIERANADFDALAREYGLEDRFDFVDFDFSQIPDPKERRRAKAKAVEMTLRHVKALSLNPQKVTEQLAEVNKMSAQAEKAARLTEGRIQEGANVNLFTKFYRENISQYFGLSEDEMVDQLRDKELQRAMNGLLKIQSGAAVSASEYERFKQGATTLYRTNNDIAMGLRGMIQDQVNLMDGLKAQVGGEHTFNILYGKTYKRLNETLDLLGGRGPVDKVRNKEESQYSEIGSARKQRRKESVVNRDQVSQYPDGTVLQGKDGNRYILMNGKPVLEGNQI